MIRVVIEPHADDAFLSLGGHLEEWKKLGGETWIMTIYGNKRRLAEAESYAKAVGANWIGIGIEESGCGQTGTCPLLDSAAIARAFTKPLEGTWMTNPPMDVFLPSLDFHPEHVQAREAVERVMELAMAHSKARVLYYLDQPYASKTTRGADVTRNIKGCVVESYMKPPAKKYRHAPIFKTQAKFFHFNPPESLTGNVELIMRDDL